MEDKITIIEGPPPTFEEVSDGWAVGLNEGPLLYDLKLTRLRTFNGPALVERCYRAWRSKSSIYLHYRDELGLEEIVPIMAARSVETEDGGVILLWVRKEPEDIEVELGFEDDLEYDDEDEDKPDSDSDQDEDTDEDFDDFEIDN
ncbi:MAG: hypothetical protein LLG42_13765 [Chloroflexi bacterium]|nr:hypothetical protein [Chloroflexota bacterium]